MGGDVAPSSWPPRRSDILLVPAALVCAALKVAVDAGAPRPALTVSLWLFAALALILALQPRPRECWLDGWRLLLLLVALWQVPGVYGALGGDGYEYYAFPRSALFDRDLQFANDFAGLGSRPVLSSRGEITSRVPIGVGLVWAPFVVGAHVGTTLATWAGASVRADGFSMPYTSAVTLASFLYGWAGLLLLESLLRPRYGRAVAALVVVAIFLATPLQFYMVANPFMSHAPSVFAACLMVFLWLRARDLVTRRAWAWVGAAAGLLCLIRSQDAVLAALPLLDLLARRRTRRLDLVTAFVLGPLLAVLLQVLVWFRMYGADFVSVVAESNWVGQTSPQVMGVLFSPRHGLFTWTPLYVLCVFGWFGWLRRDLRLGALFLLGFALCVFVNSLLADWWGSHAFGQRRLLVLTALFALGLGESLDFLRRRPVWPLAALVLALVVWNRQLASIYQSESVAAKGQAITVDRLLPAQVDLLTRRLVAAQDVLPSAVWAVLYDNLRGLWLDDGAGPLRGEIDLGREPDLPPLVGDGWFAPETEGGVTLRRSRGRRSWLRLPLRWAVDTRVFVRARPEYEAVPVTLRLEVNGRMRGEAPLRAEWADYEFLVPGEAWRTGFNDVALVYSTTPRETIPDFHGRNAAVAVDRLWLAR
jgi:hypothetical protein